MDVAKIIDELRAEREALEEAIITLERVAHGHRNRRGRPPAWLAEARCHPGTAAPSSASKRARTKKSQTT